MSSLPKIVLPLGVIVVFVVVGAVLVSAKPEPESSPEEVRPRAVFVEPVQSVTTDLTVITEGEVRAVTDINLVAEVSGKVVYVSPEFTEGGVFAAGELLLQIEESDYAVAVANAEAEVARQETLLDQSIADAEVAKQQLSGKRASALGLKKPQVAEARAGLAAAQARLAQAQLNLERTRVSLPFNGRIRTDNVGLGQFVAQGSNLAQVFASDQVEVRVPLTDQQLTSLGLPIGYVAGEEAGPDVMLYADIAGHTRAWAGTLARVDSAYDTDTRVLFATVRVAGPYSDETYAVSGAPLAVGLYVRAEISGREIADAITIPREALRAGNRVFVVNDGALDIRTVEVEHTDLNTAVIAQGLDLGDQVVVSPVRDPINGMKVEAINPQGTVQEQVAVGGDKS